MPASGPSRSRCEVLWGTFCGRVGYGHTYPSGTQSNGCHSSGTQTAVLLGCSEGALIVNGEQRYAGA